MSTFCEDRVVIVTGAGRGIGREYALMLAEHGAKVVVNDLGGARDGVGADLGPADEVVAEIRAKGGEAIANGANVADFAAAKGMIDQAIQTYGRLDVLVNNAGILRDRMLVNMQESEWDAVINVHLKGTFAPAHHAAAYWRDQSKSGNPIDARLINTTSVSGIYGNAGQTNYGAAKAGIAAFTIIASRELKRYGVTVNCIAPGALTRLTEDLQPGEITDECAGPRARAGSRRSSPGSRAANRATSPAASSRPPGASSRSPRAGIAARRSSRSRIRRRWARSSARW